MWKNTPFLQKSLGKVWWFRGKCVLLQPLSAKMLVAYKKEFFERNYIDGDTLAARMWWPFSDGFYGWQVLLNIVSEMFLTSHLAIPLQWGISHYHILLWRVWSWLRMNASYRLNTCKSRGIGGEHLLSRRRPAHGWVTRIQPAHGWGITLRKQA